MLKAYIQKRLHFWAEYHNVYVKLCIENLEFMDLFKQIISGNILLNPSYIIESQNIINLIENGQSYLRDLTALQKMELNYNIRSTKIIAKNYSFYYKWYMLRNISSKEMDKKIDNLLKARE